MHFGTTLQSRHGRLAKFPEVAILFEWPKRDDDLLLTHCSQIAAPHVRLRACCLYHLHLHTSSALTQEFCTYTRVLHLPRVLHLNKSSALTQEFRT
eukprot:565807-Pleurochrysis_carterae.AAC.1